MRLIIILTIIALALTACGSDPLGIVTRQQIESAAQVQTEQIRADAQVQQARIDASTARVRIGGWMVVALIAGAVVVLVAIIAALTHLQANRDRLMADAYRNTLPSVEHRTALPTGRPVSRRPAITQRHTLALPMPAERDADVIVIDA